MCKESTFSLLAVVSLEDIPAMMMFPLSAVSTIEGVTTFADRQTSLDV